MDVVGSGASVLAFVGIALQSTKAVFQVVSAIKNGSAKVKHLLSATEDLANVLQQIECSLNASNIGQDLDTREIHRLVAKCASDLSAIATDVKRLREIPSEAGIRKGFKRVKIMLKKDEFAEMSTIVSHHFHAIQMQMSLLHSANTVEIGNAQRSAGLQMMSALSENTDQVARGTAQTESLKKAVDELTTRISDLAVLSTEQAHTLQAKLEDLHDHTISKRYLPSQSGFSSNVVLSTSSDFSDGLGYSAHGQSFIDEGEEELARSIERLARLADEKARTASSAEAESIIDDVQTLIDILPPLQTTKRRKVGGQSLDTLLHLHQRDLRKIRGLLDSSDTVAVNERSIQRSRREHAGTWAGERRRQAYAVTGGLVTVTSRTTQSCQSLNTWRAHDPIAVDFAATIQFRPTASPFGAKIAIRIEQSGLANGSIVMPPSILVCPLISKKSEIIHAVISKDLGAFRRLIERRKASVADCDPWGRSLLSYACTFRAPSICRFLINQGASVDAMDTHFSHVRAFDGDSYCPLYLSLPSTANSYVLDSWTDEVAEMNMIRQSASSTEEALDCMRCLLDGGADPLAGYYPPLCAALDECDVEAIEAILDHASPPINIEDALSSGCSPLQHLATKLTGHGYGVYATETKGGYDVSRMKDAIDALVTRGADINSENQAGRTILFHLVTNVRRPQNSNERDLLKFLLERGSDPLVRDRTGTSIFDTIVTYRQHDIQADIGTYRSDLWYWTLHQSGLDVSEYKKRYTWSEQSPTSNKIYEQSYTAEAYVALTEGKPWALSFPGMDDTIPEDTCYFWDCSLPPWSPWS